MGGPGGGPHPNPGRGGPLKPPGPPGPSNRLRKLGPLNPPRSNPGPPRPLNGPAPRGALLAPERWSPPGGGGGGAPRKAGVMSGLSLTSASAGVAVASLACDVSDVLLLAVSGVPRAPALPLSGASREGGSPKMPGPRFGACAPMACVACRSGRASFPAGAWSGSHRLRRPSLRSLRRLSGRSKSVVSSAPVDAVAVTS